MLKESLSKEEVRMLQKLMALLPGFTTKCTTAQLKTVQHNTHDAPQIYWCCWVYNENGEKQFAMLNYEMNKVKAISEEKKKTLIIKPVKK